MMKTMKRMQGRWQAWLDGVTMPVFEDEEETPSGPDFFSGPETVWTASAVQTRAQQRRPQRHEATRTALRELREQDDGMRPERPYEHDLGPIARDLLADMDITFTKLLAEKVRARVWRGTMIARRTARNQRQVLVDVEHLWRDDVPEEQRVAEMVGSIKRRALHASDDEAPTGVLPALQPVYAGMDEEPES